MRSNLFLTSSLGTVAKDLSSHLEKSVDKFLFIITASEVKEKDLSWRDDDRKSLTKLGYKLEDYSVTDKTKDEIANKLAEVDGIIMEGGNTFYLLQQIQLSKSAVVFREFVENGGVYIGSSAGSIIAGPDIYPVRRLDNLKDAPKIKGYKGLGLTDIVILPHWGSPYFKSRYMTRWQQNYNLEHKIIPLTDNQYLVFEKDSYRIVDVTNDK